MDCELHRYVYLNTEKDYVVFECHECGRLKMDFHKKENHDLIEISNGCWLYWKICDHTGARIYYSDEIDGGVEVWNTALVSPDTLLQAFMEHMNVYQKDE